MNNPWLDKVILNFFTSRIDLFGEKNTYLGFEANESNKNSTETLADGYKSVQRYGKIVFEDEKGNTCKSTPLMIKAMPDEVSDEFLSFAFTNEINFYTKTVPILGTLDNTLYSLFPKFYHGEMTFSELQTRSAIIFEDLTAKGYKLAEKRPFLDYQHLALMMRKVGQFHAYSYKAKNTLPHWFPSMAKSFQETDFFLNALSDRSRNFLISLAQRGFGALEKDVSYMSRISILFENAYSIYKRELTADDENPISIITHGDYFRNNVMFRYSENDIPEDLLMIDMASCRYGSPVIDLANVVYLNADQEMRNKHWDELIDEYYSSLRGTFPDCEVPSKSAILKEFFSKSFHKYIVASYLLPRLIAKDNKIFYPQHVDPEIVTKFDEIKSNENISEEMYLKLSLVVGGEQGTQALKDILRDMIDRGFIL